MFRLFADLIAFHLETAEELKSAEDKLRDERKTAELREQFIAILGHDLRNPVGAIQNNAQLMPLMPLDKKIMPLVKIIKNSSYPVLGLIEKYLTLQGGGWVQVLC